MKISDLPATKSLRGVKFRHPESGETCIWHSQWDLGVWYKKPDDIEPDRVYPLPLDDIACALNMEVIDEET